MMTVTATNALKSQEGAAVKWNCCKRELSRRITSHAWDGCCVLPVKPVPGTL